MAWYTTARAASKLDALGGPQLEEILARNDADRTAKKDLHHSSKCG
jgi:hypothetical protein